MGANLKNLAGACGKQYSPGTKAKLYISCSCEHNTWPGTRAAVNSGTASGDTKILDEPFDFSTAPAGQGYWRVYDILVDTGNFTNTLEGVLGGRGFRSGIAFTLPGSEAAQLELADALKNLDGFLIAMIELNTGSTVGVGIKDRPAQLESYEINSGAALGDVNGAVGVIRANTGDTGWVYDAETHGIDITPNA